MTIACNSTRMSVCAVLRRKPTSVAAPAFPKSTSALSDASTPSTPRTRAGRSGWGTASGEGGARIGNRYQISGQYYQAGGAGVAYLHQCAATPRKNLRYSDPRSASRLGGAFAAALSPALATAHPGKHHARLAGRSQRRRRCPWPRRVSASGQRDDWAPAHRHQAVSGELVDIDLDCPEALALADNRATSASASGRGLGSTGTSSILVMRAPPSSPTISWVTLSPNCFGRETEE